jgi:hypothetical protein
MAFWDEISCHLVGGYRHFTESCYLHLQDEMQATDCSETLVPVYSVSVLGKGNVEDAHIMKLLLDLMTVSG